MCRHQFCRFDFHAVNRPFVVAVRGFRAVVFLALFAAGLRCVMLQSQ